MIMRAINRIEKDTGSRMKIFSPEKMLVYNVDDFFLEEFTVFGFRT